MKVLNLYAGLGGNRRLWTGVTVTAVELEPDIAAIYKANNPQDTVVMGDAHQFLLDHYNDYDMVWSSPPCQTHSKMMKATRHKKNRYTDMSLYQEILFLKHFYKGLWVVENVKPYYDPLIAPRTTLGRHLYWSNFIITNHVLPRFPNFIQAESKEEVQALKDWLGIQYEGNIYYGNNHSPAQILRNCVHPETGLHILNCALRRQAKLQQGTLSI